MNLEERQYESASCGSCDNDDAPHSVVDRDMDVQEEEVVYHVEHDACGATGTVTVTPDGSEIDGPFSFETENDDE